jgi:hypothetical protein
MTAQSRATPDQQDSADLAQHGYYLAVGRNKAFAPVVTPAGDDAPLVTGSGTAQDG